MYIKLEDSLLEEIEERTSRDYEAKLGNVPEESIEPMLKDLIDEIHKLDEKIVALQKDIDENYEPKKFDPYYEYGISEKDFI